MSSVRDRIRNLQQSATTSEPSQSVAERAKAVESGSEPNVEKQKPLSQLKKTFDSNVATESGSGLGARVARFDSDTSQTLQERVRRLASGAADTGSLTARASAFEREGSVVKDVAGQFTQRDANTDDTNSALLKARAMFETGSKQESVEAKVSALKLAPEDDGNPAGQNHNTKVSSTLSMKEKPASPASPSPQTATGGVSSRAAMFERSESEPHPDARSPDVTQRDPPKSLPSFSPIRKSNTSETRDFSTSDVPDEKNVKDQLRSLKETNEKLVAMLLELTAAFKRVEHTRDDLQTRLAELEKK